MFHQKNFARKGFFTQNRLPVDFAISFTIVWESGYSSFSSSSAAAVINHRKTNKSSNIIIYTDILGHVITIII